MVLCTQLLILGEWAYASDSRRILSKRLSNRTFGSPSEELEALKGVYGLIREVEKATRRCKALSEESMVSTNLMQELQFRLAACSRCSNCPGPKLRRLLSYLCRPSGSLLSLELKPSMQGLLTISEYAFKRIIKADSLDTYKLVSSTKFLFSTCATYAQAHSIELRTWPLAKIDHLLTPAQQPWIGVLSGPRLPRQISKRTIFLGCEIERDRFWRSLWAEIGAMSVVDAYMMKHLN